MIHDDSSLSKLVIEYSISSLKLKKKNHTCYIEMVQDYKRSS